MNTATVVITATPEVLVRQPGRYAHRALQDRTNYACTALGKRYDGHNNLETIKRLVREAYYREHGTKVRVLFQIEKQS